MTAFADASALVKRYVAETGSELVRARDLLVVSALSGVEVPSAFARLRRDGHLSGAQADVLHRRLTRDLSGGDLVVLDVDPVLDAAARLLQRHPLRAGDAVQLASASAAREVDPSVTELLCFDRRLGAAAAAEGFLVVGGTAARQG